MEGGVGFVDSCISSFRTGKRGGGKKQKGAYGDQSWLGAKLQVPQDNRLNSIHVSVPDYSLAWLCAPSALEWFQNRFESLQNHSW